MIRHQKIAELLRRRTVLVLIGLVALLVVLISVFKLERRQSDLNKEVSKILHQVWETETPPYPDLDHLEGAYSEAEYAKKWKANEQHLRNRRQLIDKVKSFDRKQTKELVNISTYEPGMIQSAYADLASKVGYKEPF